MSRTQRWLTGAASAALLMGLAVPATGHADTVTEPTNHAGACEGDSGVTMVIDYQGLGGGAEVRCFTGDPADGVEALRGAGFTFEGPAQFADSAVCRINGRPATDETIPLDNDPTYTEDCAQFPPANGYWSYWQSSDRGQEWDFSQMGIAGTDPEPGDWEGWSFSLNATASTNPAPRTGLAMAQYRNPGSTGAAAQWIADQWNPDTTQFAAGLADNILALTAAKAHPEVVTEMAEALVTAAPAYVTKPDSLAKVLIALDAAGQDTQYFLSCERDLSAELDAFVAANGANLDSWWGPHLISIALNRTGKPVPQNVFDLLIDRQKDDGSFGFGDDTGLAISALVGISENDDNSQAMRAEADAAIEDAVAWAQDPANQEQQGDGYYWPSFSPANSTGMLAGALAEADEADATYDVDIDIAGAQAFMQAQQELTGVGAWSNTLDGTNANLMATTQGIFAVAGTAYGKASYEVDRVTTACSAPTFSRQPASASATVGETVTFTVAANGNPEPTYTWEQFIGGTWTTISGANEATLSLADVGINDNGTRVRATATNSVGATTSDPATLTVTEVATTPPATTPPATTPPATTPPATTPPATTPPVTTPPVPPAPSYPAAIYSTPGYHEFNGRDWFTSCEPYSVTQRCRTLIRATTVSEVNGKFVTKQGWALNNLTYLPSSRSKWTNNPLGAYGEVGGNVTWTADGRTWRTECDTALTGRGGCRTFAEARVIESITRPGRSTQYRWVTKEILNNIVQFS